MNGLTRARRWARPARIALASDASDLGRDIDGAWWPHTDSLGDELPELIAVLHRPLGQVIDISVNWSSPERTPNLNAMPLGPLSVLGWHDRRQRLMLIGGRRACAKLLVVPHTTSLALGLMVMRRAAAIPVPNAQQDDKVFAAADCVVRAARAESAAWAERTRNAQAPQSRTAQLCSDA
jgi:hypothetical protein